MRPDSTIPWKAFPAAGIALMLGAGVLWAESTLQSFSLWMAGVGLGLALLGLSQFIGRHRLASLRKLAATLAIAWTCFFAGGLRHSTTSELPGHHIGWLAQAADGATATVAGRVLTAPQTRETRTHFLLATTAYLSPTDSGAVTGKLRVTLAASPWEDTLVPFPSLEPGDLVRLTGRLRPPPPRRNPADFDYGTYLRQRGLYATLSVYEPAAVVRLGHQQVWYRALLHRAREGVRTHLAQHIRAPEARSVLLALTLGDRSGLDEATRQQWARAGLMHLLAVSGLHVMLVGWVFYQLLRPTLLRLGLRWQQMEWVRSVLTLALLLTYVLLTGGQTSVVRAFVMAVLVLGQVVFQRSAHLINTLGVAALIVLMLNPASLFTAGFQLSFAAVAAIALLTPVFERGLPQRWQTHPALRWLTNMVLVSLAATLGTLPVLLYHFGQASFAGLLLNIPAIPLTGGTLLAGLLTIVFGSVPGVGAAFGAAAEVLAGGLLVVAQGGEAGLGWATVERYVTDAWLLGAGVACLGMLAQWPRPRYRWRLLALALALLAGGLWQRVLMERYRPALEVLFFEVGQGDAALVTLPNQRTLLIDAGPRGRFSDQGGRTLLPHLRRYGIDRLDAAVISHPHSDHLGGLPTLLREVPIDRVLDNGLAYGSALYAETQHLLDSLGTPHRMLRAGDTLALDPTVQIQILSPHQPDTSAATANDASVVLRLRYGETCILFTGDAEAAAERMLVDAYAPLLRCEVVKVAHHGSPTSSIPPFVQTTAAEERLRWAVVSVGRNNIFRLPSPAVVGAWEATGAKVWTTGDGGALWLRSDGTAFVPVRWR